jgi:hypothetical protein
VHLMKWSHIRTSLLFAALAATIAATAIAAAKGANRPLKLEGQAVIVAGDPGELQTTAGSGKGSHLGKVTSSGDVTFGPSSLGPTFVLGTGSQVFTAANGDQLFTSFSGDLNLDTLTATVPFLITGGTGRFQGASGSFTAEIGADSSLTSFTFDASGNITY